MSQTPAPLVSRSSPHPPQSWTIRPAQPDDSQLLVNLVHELAVYEKLEHQALATAEDFVQHLFGPNPVAEAAIAQVEEQPVGFALWFVTFSTFRGRPGIYLEDVFVRPTHRGLGIGKGFLAMLAQLALERGYARLEWSVLNWNSPAIGFYRSLGALPMNEWTVNRLDGPALEQLAAHAASIRIVPQSAIPTK